MNNDLYNEAVSTIDEFRADSDPLNGEMIEDVIVDIAAWHDNKDPDADPWNDIDDIAKVVRAVCGKYGVDYDDGE